MKKRFKVAVVLVLVASFLSLPACGFLGDPMLDDLWSRNIYPGDNATYDIGTTINRYRNGFFGVMDADNITLAGVSLSVPAYGELYITTPIATTCAVEDTYYKVSGNTTADELFSFSQSIGRLTYTGSGNRTCLVTAAISVSSSVNNIVLSTKIYVNGVAHEASLIQRKIATAGDIGAQALVALVTLSTNDYIEIYIASNKVANVTFNCMTLTVTSVD